MIVATASVYAMSALALMMIIIAVYFTIFFMIFYGIAGVILLVLRPVLKLLS